MSREIPPLHEVARLEYEYRFLFFLRDIGIESALEPAVESWRRYMFIQGQLTVGG